MQLQPQSDSLPPPPDTVQFQPLAAAAASDAMHAAQLGLLPLFLIHVGHQSSYATPQAARSRYIVVTSIRMPPRWNTDNRKLSPFILDLLQNIYDTYHLAAMLPLAAL
ncbi:hypothetical protein CEP52_014909 [Fusarium oligoseptatum]|uniref:Uncharacterized protein n=1 Tax=Fusarium oligoseptatum TaxID=2604345 RepID=A0A428SI23_9HYPO|nr:hypothetical protein CEP52_014909 [Fusarium oligoseptatum]